MGKTVQVPVPLPCEKNGVSDVSKQAGSNVRTFLKSLSLF